VLLNLPLVAPDRLVSFRIAPNGRRVAYDAWLGPNNTAALYDVPIERQSDPIELVSDDNPGWNVVQPDYAFGPRSATLLHRYDLDTFGGGADLVAAVLELPRRRALTR
jgi:hypothetical protein